MGLGFALLGAGIFATREHLPAIEAAEQLDLKAVYSRSQKSAETLQAKAQTPDAVDVYFDEPAVAGRGLGELLARADVDAVSVCLPIAMQPAVIRQALAAGKHVISEKPVAPTVAAARELLQFYEDINEDKKDEEKDGRLLWAVAENYRYQAGLQMAERELRQLGGRLVSFRVDADRLVGPDGNYAQTAWRKEPTHPGGFLLDGGVHFVAALRSLLAAAEEGKGEKKGQEGKETREMAEIAKVATFAAQLQPHLPPVDSLWTVAQTRGLVSGIISVSFGTEFGGPPLEVAVSTTEGRVVWSPRKLTITQRKPGEHDDQSGQAARVVDLADPSVGAADQLNGVKAEFEAFGQSLARSDDIDPRQSPREALKDLLVLEAMLQSGEKGGQLVDVA